MAATTQFQIKQNMDEYREFLDDLSSWQKDLKMKEEATKKSRVPQALATGPTRAIPPVRSSAKTSADAVPDASGFREHSSITTRKASSTLDNSARIKATDYRAWDRFDVDKAVEEIDRESSFGSEGVQCIKEEYELLEQQRRHESDSERLETALLEKEKGNAYFKRGNYIKAISHYTKSMEVDPHNPVLPCNRGMAYLKLRKWSEAEQDCTSALALDPKNVKALWRRGIARREAGKLSVARADIEKALILDPSNKAVKDELEKVNAAFKPVPSPTRRVPIEEIDTDSDAETKDEEERRWGKKNSQDLQGGATVAPISPKKQNPRDFPSDTSPSSISTKNAADSFFDMRPVSTRRLNRAE